MRMDHHKALTTLLQTKGMNRAGMRITCWTARLLSFQYGAIFRPGKRNVAADSLSLSPLPCSDEVVAEPELIGEILPLALS